MSRANKKAKSTAQPRETYQYHPPEMQLATILSDLNSLRASNNDAALALVSARPPPATTVTESSKRGAVDTNHIDSEPQDVNLSHHEEAQLDPDLARAFELLKLHKSAKLAYTDSETVQVDELHGADDVDVGAALGALRESRESVKTATRALGLEDHSNQPVSEDLQDPEIDIVPANQTQDAGLDGSEYTEDDQELSAWS